MYEELYYDGVNSSAKKELTLRAFKQSFLELQLSAWLASGYEKVSEIYKEIESGTIIYKVKICK